MESPFNPQAKMLCQVRKVVQFLDDPFSIGPSLVEISPSDACNHNCTHCMYAHTHQNAKLSYLIIDQVIKDLGEMGVPAVNWTGGGEPLMNRTLYDSDMLYKVKLQDIKQGLFTNGSLLTNPDHMYKILRTHEWVRFSLDAATPETYQAVHNPSATFDTVLGNIREFLAMRDELESQTTIGIGMVVNPQNYTEIEEFIQLGQSLGVDYVQVKPSTFTNHGDYWLPISWEDEQFYNMTCCYTQYKWDDLFEEKQYDQCFAHYFVPYVGGDGKVYICPQLQGTEWVLGNLNEESFQEVWNGNQRREQINALNDSNLEMCPTICRGHEINKFLWNIEHCNIPHQEFI